MRTRVPICLAACAVAAVTGCGSDFPDIPPRLTATSAAADFPPLVPLSPLLAQVDATGPRVAATEGLSLEARAADLRRRAAWLRSLQL